MTDASVSVYDTIDDLNENQWNNVVQGSALGEVFQRYGWLHAIEHGLDRTPRHVVVAKKGNPIALLPNFLDPIDLPVDSVPGVRSVAERFSLRRLVSIAPGYGGPLITSSEQTHLPSLFDALAEACGDEAIYHAVKTDDVGYARYGQFLAGRGYDAQLLNCRFVLDLDTDFEDLLQRMGKTRRRAIRRAREQDYEIETTPLTTEAVARIYPDYVRNMERIGGGTHPRSFFERLATDMTDRLRVFTAIVDGETVGRYVHVLDEERSAIQYFFSAIPDEDDLEHYPSELLHGHAIEWAMKNGYTQYDFGASGADFTDGVFRYKEQYGGRLVPAITWQKGIAPGKWNAFRLGRWAYQRSNY
jgi:predicted N-acyltransferase